MPDATLQDAQGRDLARVSVEDAAEMLAAVKSSAVKGVTLDAAANTIAGFLSGGPDDAQIASKLSEAELYWYFANHHPWIGSATELIALTIAGAGYDIVAPGSDRDQDAVDRDPRVAALRLFLSEINPDQMVEDLVEELALDRDIVGRFYIHILRLPGNKKMVGLERLDSRTTAPVLSADGRKIEKFVQKTRVRGKVVTTTYDPADIIFGKRAGGADVLGRGSPIEELDLTLAVDWGARKHTAAYFRNGASAGIIATNKSLDKTALETNKKLLADRHAGADNAYKILMLAGEWEISRPTTDGDEEFSQAQDRARQEICSVYHVPEAKLMTTKGALGGNGKDADDQTFHEECVMPRARYIWRTLSRAIMREFGIADLVIQPKAKYSLRVSMIEKAKELLQSGGTMNEARGLMELPKSAAKIDLDMPIAAALLKSAEHIISPPKPPAPVAAEPKPADGDPPAKKAGARDGGHTEALAEYVATHLADIDEATPRLKHAILAAREALEAAFWDHATVLGAHKSAVVAAPGDDDPRLYKSEAQDVERAINALSGDRLAAALFDGVEALYDLGWKRSRLLLDVHVGFDEPPTETIERLRADAEAFSFLAVDREKVALRSILTEALNEGWSVKATAAAIQATFAEGFHVDPEGDELRQTGTGRVIGADDWAHMVAQTELSRASNAGAFDFYRAAGLKKARWIAADGPHTCPKCRAADEQVVEIGENFPDVDVPAPPAHPLCVCALSPADDDLADFRGTAQDRAAAARGNQPEE